ncbi:MAG: hypothetical protein ICV87_06320 [Gemmatimonadetes bacterium]|nr:hypothetical protein [Gemmatimonadota bacterium]
MSSDDEAARIERARRLRREAESLVHPEGEPPGPEVPAEPETPRDFIHRRMREIEEGGDDPSGTTQ